MSNTRSGLAMAMAIGLGITMAALTGCETSPGQAHAASVEPAELGDTDRVHVCGDVLLASQPAEGDFATLRQQGYRSVLNLRHEREMNQLDFDQAEAITSQGMHYYHVPVGGADELTDDVFDHVRQILNNPGNRPVLVHCASANRVGAVWLAHRVLDAGVAYEDALAEAEQVGLRSDALMHRARDYIDRHQ